MRSGVWGLLVGFVLYALVRPWRTLTFDAQRLAAAEESTSSHSAGSGDSSPSIVLKDSGGVSVPTSPPRSPRVLCWVPTRAAKGDLINRIWATWAKTCDKIIFTSTEANPEHNVIRVDYPTNKDLWNIIHPAWTYVEEHLLNDYDWFVKLDDDTYFCGDNFKHLVKDLDPDGHWYLGHTAFHVQKRLEDPTGPFNLGAGHALSRGSLKHLGPFLPDSKKPLPPGFTKKCDRWNTWAEDVMLSDCLFIAGLGGPNNTRDDWGRENFMSFAPEDNFLTVRRPDSSSWFWRGKPKTVGSGAKCCSSRPILWHNLKESRTGCFFYLEYFLYGVMVDPIR